MATGEKVLPGKLTYEIVPEEEADTVKETFRSFAAFKNFIRVTPSKYMLSDAYLEVADLYYNFKFQPNDVIIMAFPKSGTTWLEEIVWTMRHNPNLDNPKAQETINVRSPFMELDILDTSSVKADPINRKYQFDQNFSSKKDVSRGFHLRNVVDVEREKRQMKTHLTFDFYPPDMLDTCKVVCIMRNPKDVIQSAFNFGTVFSISEFCGDFECMTDSFINNRILFGPYWEHVRELWEKRHHPNVHVVFYEQLLKNPEAEIRKLDEFLETNLSEEQLKNVTEHTSFKKMKKRDEESERPLWNQYLKDDVVENEGGFFRKGQVGSWKKLSLSDDMNRKLNQWIQRNEERIGVSFRYE